MVAETKHFSLPFRFDNVTAHAAEVEQDTLDDVVGCVYVAFLVQPGFRIEVPSFGVPSQVFNLQPLSLEEMVQAANRWEGRASILMAQIVDPADLAQLTARLNALVSSRSNTGG